MRQLNENLIPELKDLIAEEMFLLGQELDDSLGPRERQRLTELSGLLDQANELLAQHRATTPRS